MSAVSTPSRAAVWEWTQVALLVANLAWTTLCLGGYRPETMVVTSALNGALLAVYLLGGASIFRAHRAGWLLLPFLAYAAANVIWITPVPWLGWADWLGWAQMIAVFWVVLNGVRSKAARATLVGALFAIGFVAVVLGAYQRFVKPDWLMLGRIQADQFIGRASGPFGIPNSLAALLLLLLPAAGALAVRRGASAIQRVFWGYLALVLAFGLVLTISRGAWLAFALVAAAWPVVATRGPALRRIGLALAVLAGMVALVVTLFSTVPHVRERLTALKTDSGERSRPIMWRGAWRIFLEHPVQGGGAGSFNVLFEKHRPEGYQDEPHWAHNDYINTLSDYGAAGFVLFFGAVAAIAWTCGRGAQGRSPFAGDSPRRVSADRLPPDPRRTPSNTLPVAALAAGLAAFALQLFVDFHFKLPALAMAAAVIAAIVVQRTWPARSGEGSMTLTARACGVLAALAVIVGTVFLVLPLYRGEAARYAARQAIDRMALERLPVASRGPVLARARTLLNSAIELAPRNGQAWADLAYVIALNAHAAPGEVAEIGREAERAADRALALSKVVPEFWVRRGVALDLQGRWIEAGEAFVRALKLAPTRATMWYHQAYHLSLSQTDLGPARAAVTVCLRLDPANREAQALRQRMAERGRVP